MDRKRLHIGTEYRISAGKTEGNRAVVTDLPKRGLIGLRNSATGAAFQINQGSIREPWDEYVARQSARARFDEKAKTINKALRAQGVKLRVGKCTDSLTVTIAGPYTPGCLELFANEPVTVNLSHASPDPHDKTIWALYDAYTRFVTHDWNHPDPHRRVVLGSRETFECVYGKSPDPTQPTKWMQCGRVRFTLRPALAEQFLDPAEQTHGKAASRITIALAADHAVRLLTGESAESGDALDVADALFG